ncbi:uncharacterized protein JN550_005902 [Neoarthrinium moseri]|uniref:uncharacterized protein n=1 Tax=Neoarthrinium moseri TaxID=1658444 RepID=UPI001FDE27A6|nr:uncharacterized protein JN550_005902 [Neoarthrinium moseri]KAI1869272.1 hypothetical protein JN550_005902 [Neoarthrinium moseri]
MSAPIIRSRRTLHGLLLALVFIYVLFLTSKHVGQSQGEVRHETVNDKLPVESDAPSRSEPDRVPEDPYIKDPACSWMPDSSKILVIMKTGASEAFNKVPTQLMTNLRCLSDFLIFSDMKQTIAGLDILDSLDTVLPEAMKDNEDFELYHRQKSCLVGQEHCNSAADNSASGAGWELDKYKNVHIAEKAFSMRPDYDWYVTIDADTYLLIPNLVQWLSTLDSKKKWYLGSAASYQGFPFAHGGSGYILSHAALQDFAGNHPGIANQYDTKIKEVCCGDYMLAQALKDTIDLGIKNVWPTINGEKPFTMPIGPRQFCEPLVTMHHLSSEEMSSFWEFEQRFYESQKPGPDRTLRVKDVFHEFVKPRLQEKREDWDNLSEDWFYFDPEERNDHTTRQKNRRKKDRLTDLEKVAHKSYEDCSKMCDSKEECFQFRFEYGVCSYGKDVVIGNPRKKSKDEKRRWMSGWKVERVEAWLEKNDNCEHGLWAEPH